MNDFNFQKRVKDLRRSERGEGVIVGYVNEFPESADDPAFWIIRWDDPGLDNEWLEEREFEVIPDGRQVVNHIFIFPNGNVVVTGNDDQQIPELQGSWINFNYIRRLAEIAIRDNARVIGRMPDDHLGRLMRIIQEGKGGQG